MDILLCPFGVLIREVSLYIAVSAILFQIAQFVQGIEINISYYMATIVCLL